MPSHKPIQRNRLSFEATVDDRVVFDQLFDHVKLSVHVSDHAPTLFGNGVAVPDGAIVNINVRIKRIRSFKSCREHYVFDPNSHN